MDILAIETSCDETAAAVVRDGRRIVSSVVHTQVEEHGEYGGVVPEIASRRHIEHITQVVDAALKRAGRTLGEVDAVAVTAAPGLIGALLVGVNYAKGLALAADKPLIPVHHLRGHLAANYLADTEGIAPLEPPYLGLVVSGGHSHVVEVFDYTRFHVVGRTRDDAAGECFDKAARSMGLAYPGGVSIDRVGAAGNPDAYPLPEPRVSGSEWDMSFSGLKTAVVNLMHHARQKGETVSVPDLAASLNRRVSQMLVSRMEAAARALHHSTLAVAGGVSANSMLRCAMQELCGRNGWRLFLPPVELCGDNAAMIGAQAFYEFQAGHVAHLSLNGLATMEIEENFS